MKGQADLFGGENYAVGALAAFPEKLPCYCRGQQKHWHTNEHIWNGARWLPTSSQAGIDFLASIVPKNRCS